MSCLRSDNGPMAFYSCTPYGAGLLSDPADFLCQRGSGQQFIGFFVLGNGLVDDILGQIIIAVRMGLKPVADELLVKGGLAVAGFIAFQGPETAAVRSQHFIAQDNAAIFIQTELELGVGNDDASAEGVIRASIPHTVPFF